MILDVDVTEAGMGKVGFPPPLLTQIPVHLLEGPQFFPQHSPTLA